MSKKSITIKTQEVLRQHEDLVRRAQAAANKDAKNHVRYIEEQNANLIASIYAKLRDVICESCGLGDSVQLCIYDERFPESPEKFVEHVKDQTGLNITASEKDEKLGMPQLFIGVDLNSPAKVYIYHGSGAISDLDFPKLLHENDKRNRLWEEFLSEFAERTIGDIHQLLDEMPDRFYGIIEKTTIRRGGATAFGDSFKFYNLRISYYRLTDIQIVDLTKTMNAKISHGEISIEKAERCLWVYIEQMPDKIVDNPVFDFKEFYDKYNQVTDELRVTFNHINDNLKLADAAEQIRTMALNHKLCYWFRDGNLKFTDLKHHFMNGPHLQTLIDELNRLHPELKIKSAIFQNLERPWRSWGRCGAHGVDSIDERIEFEYEIINEESEFFAPQCEVEGVYQQIIDTPTKIQDIACKLADALFSAVQKPGILQSMFNSDYKPWTIDKMILKTEIIVDGKKWVLDFNDIKNELFLSRVKYEISNLTNGLLNIDFAKKEYWLSPSKEPITN